MNLLEGVYDPGILKAVFLAGGPGSGKSFSADAIFGVDNIMKGTSALGLKVVNSDPAFEHFLKKRGVDPKSLGKMTQKVFNYYTTSKDNPRQKGKEMKKKLQALYEKGRLGLIIDGTGHDYGKIEKRRKKLEALGYDTAMVFVNTSLPIALKRNSKRERVLPEKLVKKSWEDVQNNMGKFQSLFGRNFMIVDNSEIGDFAKMHANKIANATKFVKSPIKNRIGKKWIQDQLKLKKLGEGITSYVPSEYNNLNLGEDLAFRSIIESITENELDLFLEANGTSVHHVDDGPGTFFKSSGAYKNYSEKMADLVGWKIVDYAMGGSDFEAFHSDRIIPANTYFPAGVPGETTPTNPQDYKSTIAYELWKKQIRKIAKALGAKFLTFKDAEVAKKPVTPDGQKIKEPNKVVKNALKEGVEDKYTFKAVFLAGGPGSGKSTVIDKIFGIPTPGNVKSTLTKTGLKIVNLDQAYEFLKKKHKLPASSNDFTDDERSLDGKLMGKARKVAQKQMDNYLAGKLGIIIDGTGGSSNALLAKKKSIEELGYDTYMIFVDTTLQTALDRNSKRTDRSLLDKVVERTWQKVQDNLKTYKSAFKSNFIKINTDKDIGDQLPPSIVNSVMKFIKKPIKNKIALKWIKQAKRL